MTAGPPGTCQVQQHWCQLRLSQIEDLKAIHMNLHSLLQIKGVSGSNAEALHTILREYGVFVTEDFLAIAIHVVVRFTADFPILMRNAIGKGQLFGIRKDFDLVIRHVQRRRSVCSTRFYKASLQRVDASGAITRVCANHATTFHAIAVTAQLMLAYAITLYAQPDLTFCQNDISKCRSRRRMEVEPVRGS